VDNAFMVPPPSRRVGRSRGEAWECLCRARYGATACGSLGHTDGPSACEASSQRTSARYSARRHCPFGAGSPDYRPLRLSSHQCFSGGAHAATRSAIPTTWQRARHAGHDSTRSLHVRPARDSYRVKNTLTRAIPRQPTRVDGLCRRVLAVGEKQPAAWVPSLAPGSASNRPSFKGFTANRPHRARSARIRAPLDAGQCRVDTVRHFERSWPERCRICARS